MIGRIPLSPVLVPWIANGVLSLSGVRHVLGGLGRRPTVHTRPDGVDLTLRGPDLRVGVTVDAPLARCVSWEYADPTGDIHHVCNCSVAGMRVDLVLVGDALRRGVVGLELLAQRRRRDGKHSYHHDGMRWPFHSATRAASGAGAWRATRAGQAEGSDRSTFPITDTAGSTMLNG